MIRKPMEDVVVHHTDTTQNVPNTREYNKSTLSSSKQFMSEENRIERNPFFDKPPQTTQSSERKNGPRSLLWVISMLAIVGVAYLVANYFSTAKIEIAPLVYHGHLEKDFLAIKEPENTTTAGGTLAFHFVSMTDENSQDVPVVAEQNVQKKASGRVTIFNAYSRDTQRLIKNTRLESADHKIFRIADSVVVPGAKIVSGKISQPGQVDIIAYADVAGKEYNIGLGDFTVPGFKGDPRYTKFTARSKSDSPIGGGFSGVVKVPSDADIKTAQDQIKESLKTTAIEKAHALIPGGMTFFPGSTVLKFEEVPQDYTAGDTAKVTVRATVSVFFFDTALLTQKFAEAALIDYQGNQVTLSNLPTITFTFLDPVNNVVLSDLSQLRFHVVGDPVFVSKIDTQKIRTILAGQSKMDFAKLIVGEHNVGKADATIRPMWKSVFPIDTSKITVTILSQ